MKIAFFCPHSDPLARPGEPDAGGQCVYEARIARALAELGHEVRAYTRLWADKPADEPLCPGATVHRFPMGPGGFLRKEDMGPYLPEFAGRVLSSPQRAWLNGADVLHGHYWDGGAAAAMASLSTGRPLVFTSHSLGRVKRERVPDPSDDGSTYNYHVRIPAEGRIMAAADAIIALSQMERDVLVDGYGVAPERIRIIPGGVDVDYYAPEASKDELKARLGLSQTLLGFTVGRLDPRKGFVELLEALPRVAERLQALGQSLRFFVPGGPPQLSPEEAEYRKRLETRVSELGLDATVELFPRLSQERLRDYYQAADVFVCPSPYEPFGLVVIEAFAAGTPVVATAFGGPPEVISPGVDGYLADPSHAEELAQAILAVLERPKGERATMGEAALAKAHKRYAWTAVAAGIAKVYEGLPAPRG